MATSGDILLAIREDFYMATDTGTRTRRVHAPVTNTGSVGHLAASERVEGRPEGLPS